ncbi:MAG: hypothetical protein R3E39_26460 [Anaerolineae bacterium]
MDVPELPFPSSGRWVRVVVALLGSDWVDMLGVLWRLARKVLSLKTHEGMYEVLEYDTQLELLDIRGEKAIFHKREQVRFLQDNIIAYQDQAWGDGDIFADYQCSPGVAVDKYREGHRYRILISLRETKNHKDVDEFRIDRTIRRGFTKAVEDFQIEIDHVTRSLSMSVVFPKQRFPKQVTLIERNASKMTPINAQAFQELPDGRLQVTWHTKRPRLFENYILRWEW